MLLQISSISPAVTLPHIYTYGSGHKPLLPNTVPHSFLSFSGKELGSPFPCLSSSSAHTLTSAPVQITVTTFSKAPSKLQTAKSKALTLTSTYVDNPNCTSFCLSSRLPNCGNYLHGPSPAYKSCLSCIPHLTAPPPNQSSKRGALQYPSLLPLPCIQPMALLQTLSPKQLQSSSPVHAHTTVLV